MNADEIRALRDDELCDRIKTLSHSLQGRYGKVFFSDVFTYAFAMRLREFVMRNTSITREVLIDRRVARAGHPASSVFKSESFAHDGTERGLCRAILQACLFVMEASDE